jgi:hypothetical protein
LERITMITLTPHLVDGALPQPQSSSLNFSHAERAPHSAEGIDSEKPNQPTFVQFVFQEGCRLSEGCIDLSLIQRYISAQMGNPTEDCLEIGRALVVLKAGCRHGEFLNRLGELGIEPRTASRFMAVFNRLSDVSFKQILSAAGRQSKLFELLPLDDEQLEALAVKGRIGPLLLSEIPSMTVMGVREAVRKVQNECLQTMDALLEEKNRLLDAERSSTTEALQPRDRIESHLAHRPGAVVKVYPDGSACILWDDGEPQGEGLGHERVPREFLVKVADGAAPAKGVVSAAFETHADTASGDVNDGPAVPHHDAALTPDEAKVISEHMRRYATEVGNIRRVDANLQVHWAGRAFDVSSVGVCVGDHVRCWHAQISPPELFVRTMSADQRDCRTVMVKPVEPVPLAEPPDLALTRRKQYLIDRMKVVLRYADGPELNSIDDMLEELIIDITRGRYVPGLVAADYELTRKYWIEGGAR